MLILRWMLTVQIRSMSLVCTSAGMQILQILPERCATFG